MVIGKRAEWYRYNDWYLFKLSIHNIDEASEVIAQPILDRYWNLNIRINEIR